MKKVMKRTMKEFASLLLVMAMVMGAIMTVYASPVEASETMADVSGHDFKAYQIFSGIQKDDDEFAYLYEAEWGSGVDGAALLADLKAEGDLYDACETAADVVEVLGTFGEMSADARAFAKLAYKHKTATGVTVTDKQTGLDAGYYLVVDETEFAEDAKDTYKNLALLQVTNDGDFDIQSKVDIPSVTKKVQDINDTLESAVGPLQDSADYDIGDNVPFTLTGTLPSRLADYDTYKYIFHDTLSEGLTYNGDAKVYAVNGNTETDITRFFTITPASKALAGGGTLTVASNNILAAKDVTLINATTSIVVRYTAVLNEDAKIGYEGNPNTVYLEYSNNPNESGEGDNNETGETPEDKVIVFTYKLDVLKTDTKNEALAGAGFTLYKLASDGVTWNEVEVIEAGKQTKFSFTGLDDGKYMLVETEVPDGYNAADPIEFVITADHDANADDPKLTKLETNNQVITVEHTKLNDYYTGVLSTTVINNEGHVLPETGGVGTTMFYVIGAILMIGAAVVMITRKRMSK